MRRALAGLLAAAAVALAAAGCGEDPRQSKGGEACDEVPASRGLPELPSGLEYEAASFQQEDDLRESLPSYAQNVLVRRIVGGERKPVLAMVVPDTTPGGTGNLLVRQARREGRSVVPRFADVDDPNGDVPLVEYDPGLEPRLALVVQVDCHALVLVGRDEDALVDLAVQVQDPRAPGTDSPEPDTTD